MISPEKVYAKMRELIADIKEQQCDDGAWRYCFESGPTTDANMIVILRVLEYEDEELIQKLVRRLLNKQLSNGAWKLYDDSAGHLSATAEAYTALLFSGYAKQSDPHMKKAEHFILENGGLKKVHVSTKFLLALNDIYHWPKIFPFPLFIMHSPGTLPISFYKFSTYVRAHFAPVLILGHKRFSIKNRWTPDLSHLIRKKAGRNKNSLLSRLFAKSAIKKAEIQMLRGVDENGTLFSYASATFYMIYALLALGYHRESYPIKNAVEGLYSFLSKIGDEYHIQNSPSTIWDTALISYALQEAGCTLDDKAVSTSANYLLSVKKKQSQSKAGGWGFSESNASPLDIDDTQAALRAIYGFTLNKEAYRKTWHSGVHWLMDKQNKDGGWGAFEKNKQQSIFALLPIQNLKDTVIDPSTADLTGRTLEFLGSTANMTVHDPRIKSGVNWLLKNQEDDGSWYGRWGISYIYGTWAAVTGMRAVGLPTDHQSIQKALEWLKSNQQPDGGWGESCKSDQIRSFVPLSYSTIVQTSWALDALISGNEQPTNEIDRGIEYLLNKEHYLDKNISYPTGAGLPGQFYIHYHSYPYIWPLLTLSHYMRKYHAADFYSNRHN